MSAWAGGKESIVAKIKFKKGLPLFRGECMVAPVDQHKLSSDNIYSLMKEQADTIGLENLQLFIEKKELGIVGTYKGIKRTGNVVMIQFGQMYFGNNSIFNIIAFEQLKNFPSKELNTVLFSVKRK